jgi:hypothetical protein
MAEKADFLAALPLPYMRNDPERKQAMKTKDALFLTEPLHRYDDLPTLPAEAAEAMDLGRAELARKLNNTLQMHLPTPLPASLHYSDEKAQAVFGAKNCIRRITLRHPDDVLGLEAFIQVVKDLLEELYWALPQTDTPRSQPSGLRCWLMECKKRGYLIPRYLVGAGADKNPAPAFPVFSKAGEVTGIRWGQPPQDAKGIFDFPPYASPVQYYRKKALLQSEWVIFEHFRSPGACR